MIASRHILLTALAITTAPIGSAYGQGASAPTVAGTVLTNVATVTAGLGSDQIAVSSNQARLTVAERLDVALRTASTTLQVPLGTSAIPFTLTNAGNGTEAFVLTAQIAGAGATIQGFAVDRNGDGVFDPAVDLAVAQGASIPPLTAGQSTPLLVLLQGNATGTAGTLTVGASALTGSGAPGTVFAGRGDGGSDALVGPTGAAASLVVSLSVGGGSTRDPITLVKSQQVAGPNGTSVPVPGATVTYTIVATFGVAAPAARLVDPIPSGTVYVAGSLSFDGAALSDAADADAGRFDGGGIAVALGDVTAPVSHTVQFKVTVQ